ncbi:MAG TPA: hypothetical protein PLF84_19500, partial [Bryobacteraceae bacterium]|nr:hypothetical protein [Bryobacteraceae bacterium]
AQPPATAPAAASQLILLARAAARRAWMRDALGISLDESVLPLSNLCGYVAPFLLEPSLVMTRG